MMGFWSLWKLDCRLSLWSLDPVPACETVVPGGCSLNLSTIGIVVSSAESARPCMFTIFFPSVIMHQAYKLLNLGHTDFPSHSHHFHAPAHRFLWAHIRHICIARLGFLPHHQCPGRSRSTSAAYLDILPLGLASHLPSVYFLKPFWEIPCFMSRLSLTPCFMNSFIEIQFAYRNVHPFVQFSGF